jgi:hypothetical protein
MRQQIGFGLQFLALVFLPLLAVSIFGRWHNGGLVGVGPFAGPPT